MLSPKFQLPKRDTYFPTIQQMRFHAARQVYKFRACICGTGSGKTLAGLAEAIDWAQEYPGSIGYIFEPNFPMVRRILIPTLESDLLLGKPLEADSRIKTFNKGEMRLDFTNESKIWFVSLEDPEKAEGPNIDWAMLDEARLVRNLATSWRVIVRRLRGSNPYFKRRIGAWITTTADKPNSDLHQICENTKTRQRGLKVFRWSIYENPFLPQDFLRDIEQSHTGALADRFIFGRFAFVGEGDFKFDQEIHVKNFPADLIERMKEIRYGVDFGWTNPSCILPVGFDGDKRAHVLDEFYASQQSREQLWKQLKLFILKYGNGPVICDATAPEIIAYFNEMAMSDSKFDKKGILFEAVGYKFKRKDGLTEVGGRFKIAGDGKPRIFIASKCVNLISELMEYKPTIKERDHAVDALRYSLPLKKRAPLDAWRFG